MTLLAFTIILICFVSVQCVANLRYYETFNNVDVSSRVRRSAGGLSELIKEVKFNVFNRHFHAIMKSGTNVLAKGFKARLVHADGRSALFNIDQSQIYSGHISGHPDVIVHAHMEDMLWSMQIFEENETYSIEPADTLLNKTENPQQDAMIAYRGSDLHSNGHSFCGAGKEKGPQIFSPLVPEDYQSSTPGKQHTDTRKKRAAGNTCILKVVGDFLLYNRRCKGNHLLCSSLLIDFVQTADLIFKFSKFEDDQFKIHTGFGLQLGELTLYTSFTHENHHFNRPNSHWDADKLLQAFAYYSGHTNSKFCLNHVFTSYPLPGHVLGYAFINNICPRARARDGSLYNTGLTSGEDISQGPVASLQMNLVFAHGHNFGSEHDPGTKECTAPDNKGGKFLMWYISVTGHLPNHKIFSPCSLKQIGRYITQRYCFLERSVQESFCGNGIIEGGEECDPGSIGIIGNDKCCDASCQLKPGAVCSDINQACCRKCQMAKKGVSCISSVESNCKSGSKCTGKSFICPKPGNLPDFTNCTEGGQCYGGICQGFCFIKSLKEKVKWEPCMCTSNTTSACKWCCYDNTDGTKSGECSPRSEEILRDGRPCYAGYCQKGLCKRVMVSTVNRLYRYIAHLEVSGLVQFMKTNIVLTVFVLSLIVWIPPSYVIYRIDSNERAEREEEIDEWFRMRSTMIDPNQIYLDSRSSETSSERIQVQDETSKTEKPKTVTKGILVHRLEASRTPKNGSSKSSQAGSAVIEIAASEAADQGTLDPKPA